MGGLAPHKQETELETNRNDLHDMKWSNHVKSMQIMTFPALSLYDVPMLKWKHKENEGYVRPRDKVAGHCSSPCSLPWHYLYLNVR